MACADPHDPMHRIAEANLLTEASDM